MCLLIPNHVIVNRAFLVNHGVFNAMLLAEVLKSRIPIAVIGFK
jgi:hypothetical protein